MKDYKDYEDKQKGDVVEVSEAPLVVYYLIYDTEELLIQEKSLDALYEHEDLIDNTAIIIEDDVDITFKCLHCDRDHHHDCAIYYPHNKKKFYTSIDNLRLVKT